MTEQQKQIVRKEKVLLNLTLSMVLCVILIKFFGFSSVSSLGKENQSL